MALPIPITGVGVVSPFGPALDRFRDALLDGRSAIAPEEAWTAAGCRSVLSARVHDFDPAKWIAPMKLRRMDSTGPLALVMASEAMRMAGYEPRADGDDRAGVAIGTWSAGGQATSDYLEALFGGGPASAPALLFNSTVGNAAAGLVGLESRLRGPNATISHKEASGLAALHLAVDLLRQDRAGAVIAGGVDAIYPLFYRTHDRFGVMNRALRFDASASPFSVTAAGFVLGEGAYGVWLDREPGDRAALGEVLGVAAGSAAVPLNAWPADPDPIARVLRAALDDAGIGPSDVDVVYASANAAPAVDAVEARALRAILGAGERPVVTAVKGALGESGAASAAAVCAALACGAVGRVPPIAGLEAASEAARGLRLARGVTAAPGPVVLVSAVASGGAIEALVLRVPATGLV